jgi:glycosyltransferase involved in cell wall biosynthesis
VPRPRVLFISAGAVGETMAGPGIRSYELARALAMDADVTLAAPGAPALPGPAADTVGRELTVVGYDLHRPAALQPLIAGADAIVAQPQWPTIAPWLARSGARLIFDLYDPEPFELYEHVVAGAGWREAIRTRLLPTLAIDRIAAAMRIGHHFICASERQRDLWLGMMLAERLIAPGLYGRDPSLADVLAVVPFGVPAEPPQRTPGRPGMRERLGLSADDEVVLWNGGIWPWLDAPGAIAAVGALVTRRARLRLVFMGAVGDGPGRHGAARAATAAREVGLLDRHVFFHDAWVPYPGRAAWLLDANCAISTQLDHLEARFAYRSRVLDCFWAGLPVVCTSGDELAERVQRDGLGATAPPGDLVRLTAALDTVLARGRAAYAPALANAARAHHWEAVAEPLVRWVTGTPGPERPGEAARSPLAARNLASARRRAYAVMRAARARFR